MWDRLAPLNAAAETRTAAHLIVALSCARDLLLRAKQLFVAATGALPARVTAAACFAKADEWNEPPLDEQD